MYHLSKGWNLFVVLLRYAKNIDKLMVMHTLLKSTSTPLQYIRYDGNNYSHSFHVLHHIVRYAKCSVLDLKYPSWNSYILLWGVVWYIIYRWLQWQNWKHKGFEKYGLYHGLGRFLDAMIFSYLTLRYSDILELLLRPV